MKALGVIFALLTVAVAVILGMASTKPSSYRVERSADINAPVAAVQPLVEDFHNWKQWSPWDRLDPNMQVTYSGSASGPGAIYEWSGNRKAGQGRMEIISSSPSETKIDLMFIKPFASDNKTSFTYAPTANGTRVTWAMSGPMPFMSKVMCVFTSMDMMIGPDFERGLAQLKAAAEKP